MTPPIDKPDRNNVVTLDKLDELYGAIKSSPSGQATTYRAPISSAVADRKCSGSLLGQCFHLSKNDFLEATVLKNDEGELREVVFEFVAKAKSPFGLSMGGSYLCVDDNKRMRFLRFQDEIDRKYIEQSLKSSEGKQELLERLAKQADHLENEERDEICIPVIYLSILKTIVDKKGVHATIGRFMSALPILGPMLWNKTVDKDVAPFLIGALQMAKESGSEPARKMLARLDDEDQYIGAMAERLLELLSGTNTYEPVRR